MGYGEAGTTFRPASGAAKTALATKATAWVAAMAPAVVIEAAAAWVAAGAAAAWVAVEAAVACVVGGAAVASAAAMA